MKNTKIMIKTMKIKSCVAALLAAFTLGLTTSCADMFDVDSNRVVINHELNTTADSVYSTLGVLQCMRKVADRYVLLGEVRGDMVEINEESTKTSIRNLANFNFDADNEYLNVRDYYAIINNCNYALAKMDTTLVLGGKFVMVDEYAALLGIRAWTYLQLAINYGEVYYYTYPIITEADAQRAKAEGKKDIKAIAADLTDQLDDFVDYDMPTFAGLRKVFPVLPLVIADLYLWSGDYENASKFLTDYFMANDDFTLLESDDNGSVQQAGYMSLGGAFHAWNGEDKDQKSIGITSKGEDYSSTDVNTSGYENLAYITMEASGDKGVTSELKQLFVSGNNTHSLYPSTYWKSLSNQQMVFLYEKDASNKYKMKSSAKVGDMRKERYWKQDAVKSEISDMLDGEAFDIYNKHNGSQINIYRRSIACLRWAEALNALALQRHEEAADSAQFADARALAVNSFYLLKDASKVFFPDSSDVQKKFSRFSESLQTKFVGIHARGAGDVYADTTYYVLKPAVIANSLGKSVEGLEFRDTVEYIDNLIIDELALESTLEGNRFGDLIRFAERRGDVDFLAKRVAGRKGAENFDTELYEKLTDKANWYLPFK